MLLTLIRCLLWVTTFTPLVHGMTIPGPFRFASAGWGDNGTGVHSFYWNSSASAIQEIASPGSPFDPNTYLTWTLGAQLSNPGGLQSSFATTAYFSPNSRHIRVFAQRADTLDLICLLFDGFAWNLDTTFHATGILNGTGIGVPVTTTFGHNGPQVNVYWQDTSFAIHEAMWDNRGWVSDFIVTTNAAPGTDIQAISYLSSGGPTAGTYNKRVYFQANGTLALTEFSSNETGSWLLNDNTSPVYPVNRLVRFGAFSVGPEVHIFAPDPVTPTSGLVWELEKQLNGAFFIPRVFPVGVPPRGEIAASWQAANAPGLVALQFFHINAMGNLALQVFTSASNVWFPIEINV